MKYINLTLLILGTLLITGCSKDEAPPGLAVSATIDGTTYTFYCNRNSITADEYNIGCSYNDVRRLNFSKARDINGGEVKVAIVDSPDISLFDSPYGISFECSLTGGTACASASVFEYDSASTTINMTDVVILQSANSTGEDGGTYVAGDASHTISTSIKLNDVPYFQ